MRPEGTEELRGPLGTQGRVMDSQTASPGGGAGVLLVEDDLVIGEFMANLLDEAGYRSLTIADHDQIGDAIGRFNPSGVILDGEVGRTAHSRSWADAAAIRRAHPTLPVLMFSADTDALAEQR